MASDFTVFVSDVLYARQLKKENHLLWVSGTDKPDLGGKEDEDNFFDAMATTEELVHTHIHPYTLHSTTNTHTTHYTLHTTHYTLHTTHYTLHTTHYTLHTTHYTLHTTHYTQFSITLREGPLGFLS